MTKIFNLDQIKEVLKNIDSIGSIYDIQIPKTMYKALILREKE